MAPGTGVLKSLQRAELSFCDTAASFLQSGFWGSFKSRFGWEALAFRAEWKNGEAGPGEVTPLLVLRRSLGSRRLSLAYIPWGPELPAYCSDKGTALKELAFSLKGTLPKDTVFIRFDPPWHIEGAASSFPSPFIRSGADIQPPDTVLVDITQSIESLMDQMKSKWRYNIRLARKKGVMVHQAGGEKIGVFYNLLKETARRDGIAIHGVEYYQALFEKDWYSKLSCKIPDIRLYLAEYEGDAAAGIVTLFRGREAVYLYGASSDKNRSLMAPYALQIKAMEDAKASGCEEYDLFGIPPNDDPAHPMAGLYRFKTGFGGRIIHRSGSWDCPCRPLVYRLFRSAETLRKNLRSIKKHRKLRSKGAQLSAGAGNAEPLPNSPGNL